VLKQLRLNLSKKRGMRKQSRTTKLSANYVKTRDLFGELTKNDKRVPYSGANVFNVDLPEKKAPAA
jgi:hypothetical protein